MSFTHSRRRRAAALLAAAALALTGCGGSSDDTPDTRNTAPAKPTTADKSTAELLTMARAHVDSAETVRIKGEVTEDDETFQVDLIFVGDDAKGRIGMGGQSFELLSAAGAAYFRADDAFWREYGGADGEAAVQLLSDKWIVVDPEDEDFGDFASLVSKDDFVAEMLEPDGDLTKGDGTTIGGIECLALIDEDQGTLYLDRTNGAPIRLAGPNRSGNIDFTYPEVKAPKKPAAADIVDLSKLG